MMSCQTGRLHVFQSTPRLIGEGNDPTSRTHATTTRNISIHPPPHRRGELGLLKTIVPEAEGFQSTPRLIGEGNPPLGIRDRAGELIRIHPHPHRRGERRLSAPRSTGLRKCQFQSTPRLIGEGNWTWSIASGPGPRFNPPPASSARGTAMAGLGPVRPVSIHPPPHRRGEHGGTGGVAGEATVSIHPPPHRRGERARSAALE